MRLIHALLAATSLTVVPVAFANTNSGGQIYVCSTPQPTTLTQAQFQALSWVPVMGIGTFGATGSTTNILTYNTWDTDVAQKSKGITDAGSPDLEVARIPTDPGQIILRNAAATRANYAIKIVRPDNAPGGIGTTIYNRGIITGPTRPNGRPEDFDLEMFKFGLNQREIVVNPTVAGNAPLVTNEPAITGTAKNGSTLTATPGTFTGDTPITYGYQWYSSGMQIAGATANTYVVQASDIGNIITVAQTGTNASGYATGTSAPTATVVA